MESVKLFTSLFTAKVRQGNIDASTNQHSTKTRGFDLKKVANNSKKIAQ
jgi:hypothetical protein